VQPRGAYTQLPASSPEKQAKHEVAGDYVLQKNGNCKERLATSVVSLTQ